MSGVIMKERIDTVCTYMIKPYSIETLKERNVPLSVDRCWYIESMNEYAGIYLRAHNNSIYGKDWYNVKLGGTSYRYHISWLESVQKIRDNREDD